MQDLDAISMQLIFIINFLFIHLIARILSIGEVGCGNYRTLRSTMEINMSTKCKLVCIQGTLARPDDDLIKVDQ